MNTDKKKRAGKIGLYVFYGALTVFILMMFLSLNNMSEIFAVLGTADVKYVLYAILLLLVYAALTPLTTCMLTRSRRCPISFGKTYVIGMTEHFFNGITPFSTGGQPFQVYAFSKANVKPSESTGVLLMNFIIMMIVTNVFAACSLVYYNRFAAATDIRVVAIVGFSINFLVLAFMIALATSRHLRNGLLKLFALLGRIKFLKKWIEPRIPQFDQYCTQVQSSFKELIKKGWTFVACLFVKAVTMAIYYAITFYILRALHVEIGYDQLFFVMCGSSFAITTVVFMPTPGSSGGIEFAFHSIFATIAGVSSTVAYGGMLMWRLMTYYLLMLISLLFYIGLEIRFRVTAKRTASALPVPDSSSNSEAERSDANPENTNSETENSDHKGDSV